MLGAIATVLSAGIHARSNSGNARHPVSSADLAWADVIFAMEEKHKSRLLAEHRSVVTGKAIHVLDIPDDYRYMDPELVEQLQTSAGTLGGADPTSRKIEALLPLSNQKILMNDTAQTPQAPALPDHLSSDARSPHHVAAVFEHEIGIRFNDKERVDVEEYCISEGWIMVPAVKTRDRKGNPLKIKLKGKVEAFYR